MGAAEATRTSFIEPGPAAIVRATDLATVEVLKLGNLYLLTDPLGDIASDPRGLGLYDGDTRILSCAELRFDGRAPVLLQGSRAGTFQGTVRMTNPSGDRPTGDEVHPLDELVGRTLDITRERVLGRGAGRGALEFRRDGHETSAVVTRTVGDLTVAIAA